MEKALADQRVRVLREFSLDDPDGALSRLVREIKQHSGEMGESVEKHLAKVVGEFSLDHEDSALSRLMSRVEQAQRQITSQFSLDEEGSSLMRMRKEMLAVFEEQRQVNEKFQIEVRSALADMTARRQESKRSTIHGIDFEADVFECINPLVQKGGDMASHVGNTTGAHRQ